MIIGVIILLVLVAFVAGINVLLVADDLRSCSNKPDANSTSANSKLKHCYKADVIVAVSGGDTTARAKRAIELYKQGWAPKIIFSGASADPRAISNAEAMKRIAVSTGVAEKNIIIEGGSKNTSENAGNTEKILTKIGAKRVILVTSSYHLRRVKMNFQKQDRTIDFRTSSARDSSWSGWWFLTPTGWWLALTEIGGIIKLTVGG